MIFCIADELQDPDPSITREEFKLLIDELEKKKCTFKSVICNVSTCWEFISAFMTTAVKHVQSIEENSGLIEPTVMVLLTILFTLRV